MFIQSLESCGPDYLYVPCFLAFASPILISSMYKLDSCIYVLYFGQWHPCWRIIWVRNVNQRRQGIFLEIHKYIHLYIKVKIKESLLYFLGCQFLFCLRRKIQRLGQVLAQLSDDKDRNHDPEPT